MRARVSVNDIMNVSAATPVRLADCGDLDKGDILFTNHNM